jgi:hypothetical protein
VQPHSHLWASHATTQTRVRVVTLRDGSALWAHFVVATSCNIPIWLRVCSWNCIPQHSRRARAGLVQRFPNPGKDPCGFCAW